MLEEAIQRKPQITRAKANPRKLNTLHGLIHGRVFEGQFAAQAKTYQFTYAPAGAVIADRHLVLSGRFTVSALGREPHSIDGVQARLIATQGGVGASPTRRTARTGAALEKAAPEQKLELEQGPETELQPGLHAFANPKYDEGGRPIVDATGPLAFVGVLYFVLSPLDGPALGVPLDLSRIQFGGRLTPTDDLGRDLQVVFSNLVTALHGERPDANAANEIVAELNSIFSAQSVTISAPREIWPPSPDAMNAI
jgi:hypothetical protein